MTEPRVHEKEYDGPARITDKLDTDVAVTSGSGEDAEPDCVKRCGRRLGMIAEAKRIPMTVLRHSSWLIGLLLFGGGPLWQQQIEQDVAILSARVEKNESGHEPEPPAPPTTAIAPVVPGVPNPWKVTSSTSSPNLQPVRLYAGREVSTQPYQAFHTVGPPGC